MIKGSQAVLGNKGGCVTDDSHTKQGQVICKCKKTAKKEKRKEKIRNMVKGRITVPCPESKGKCVHRRSSRAYDPTERYGLAYKPWGLSAVDEA